MGTAFQPEHCTGFRKEKGARLSGFTCTYSHILTKFPWTFRGLLLGCVPRRRGRGPPSCDGVPVDGDDSDVPGRASLGEGEGGTFTNDVGTQKSQYLTKGREVA